MSGTTPPQLRRDFLNGLGVTPDRFQVEAMDALDRGSSVLVAAPTGSGKTVVASYAMAQARAQGMRSFYTTPIKALSNQKFHDLRVDHGTGNAGLLTGDNAIDGDAPMVVMTTEVLRNMIYAGRDLRDLGVVVLDEVHYLQDSFRGPVWEEVIIHLPEHVRLVALSATVSNAEEIGDWLTTVRGKTEVVVETMRPVTLTNRYLVGDHRHQDVVSTPVLTTGGRPNRDGQRFDVEHDRSGGRGRGRGSARGGRPRRRWYTPTRPEVVHHLVEEQLIPNITFIFSRQGCDDAVRQCRRSGMVLTTAAERVQIDTIVRAHLAQLSVPDRQALGYDSWRAGLDAGFAAHHAGHVPPFKEAVEACFVAGLVKVVFATETLAMGINMPARSVVIERLTKFNGERRAPLTPGEYTQLTGRAGRRGIDAAGTAIVLWSPFVPFDQVAGLVANRQFALRSAFRPTYNMAVNLVRRHDRSEAERLLDLSLAQYQTDRTVVAAERHRAKRANALARAEQAATCELGDVAEYRDAVEASGNRSQRRARIGAALEVLRPGDVIVAPSGEPVAVLSTGARSDGLRLGVLDVDGHRDTLTVGDFDNPPRPVGTVDVPPGFAPNDSSARDAIGAALASVALPPTAPGPGAEHPVAACPDAAMHLAALRRVDRLRVEVDRLARRTRRGVGALSAQFERILTVLEERGHLDGWRVTETGAVLAGVYHESDLAVADALAAGVFDGLDAPELAAVASVFVYEHRAPGAPPDADYPSTRVLDRCRHLDHLVDEIVALEIAHDLRPTRPTDHGFALLAHEWVAGVGIADLLDDEGDGPRPGDFVRTVRQLVDLLRQISRLAEDPNTRRTAGRAASAAERGVVAASSGAEADVEQSVESTSGAAVSADEVDG